MKTLYVNDLRPGTDIHGQAFALVTVESATDKNNNPYYNLELADRSGQVKGKIWTDAISEVEKQALKAGRLVTISARVEEYRGDKQLNIQELSGADETKMDDYLQASSFDPEQMLKDLQEIISTKIKNKDLKKMFENMMNDGDFVYKFKYWPAGLSFHHAFRSGLLQHVLETLAMVDGLEKFYPDLDFDAVRAGIIVHDIGKTKELDASGVSPVYTLEGSVLGHIYLGTEIVEQYYPDDGDQKLLLHLKHIVLSHHGETAKGSPVVPATPEAYMVWQLEDASSKVQLADWSSKEAVQENGMTNFNKYTQSWMWADRKSSTSKKKEEIIYPE